MGKNEDKRDLLLEIGCEELPPRFIPKALTQFKRLFASLSKEHRLDFDLGKAWGTPRRLVLLVEGLVSCQSPLLQKVKGPPFERAYDAAGGPTGALLGFARSQGLSPESLAVEKVKGVPYIFAIKKLAGKTTEALLPEILTQLLRGISFSRPMYWKRKEERFPRPVRWLMAIYGSAPVRLNFAGVTSREETFGHRFISPGPFPVEDIAGYLNGLEQNRVILDQEQRREQIRRLLVKKAAAVEGRPLIDEALLKEVTFLVEYPVAVTGFFPHEYLDLPREVLITTMQVHQRFFPVLEKDSDELKSSFIGISNNLFHENIRRGYEKVLRARLADARFFYTEDCKKNLESYAGQLTDVIFHENLGTLAEKQERLVNLVGDIGARLDLSGNLIRRTRRAAQLSKADLVTRMVREFPELQGAMGREYALLSGEEPETAAALYEQYLPRYFGDTVPATLEGALLSLVDRADTLSGCFTAGIQPTGSQDPYALRRQGQGIIVILKAFELELTPAALLDTALQEHLKSMPLPVRQQNQLRRALHDFMTHRLRFLLQEKELSYDVIEAILAVPYRSVAELYRRGLALEKNLRTDLLGAVSATYIRVANLSRQSEGGEIRRSLLTAPAEKELYRYLLEAGPGLERTLQQYDYRASLELLASLKEPVDHFFDHVMVMVEDEPLRLNRLNLLASVKQLFNRLADFALLQLGE